MKDYTSLEQTATEYLAYEKRNMRNQYFLTPQDAIDNIIETAKVENGTVLHQEYDYRVRMLGEKPEYVIGKLWARYLIPPT